jgi:hypothetical protein
MPPARGILPRSHSPFYENIPVFQWFDLGTNIADASLISRPILALPVLS